MDLEDILLAAKQGLQNPQVDLFSQALANKVRKNISEHAARDSRSFLAQCYETYHHHPGIGQALQDIGEDKPLLFFANFALHWTYGLSYQHIGGRHIFQEVAKGFSRRVDVLQLADFANAIYIQKSAHYPQFSANEKISVGGKPTGVKSYFARSLWSNIFNHYKQYSGLDGKTICLFNEGSHAIASLLHSAHPNIHYLHLRSEKVEAREADAKRVDNTMNVANPLATAILFEATANELLGKSQSNRKYLVVEGVLANFQDLDYPRDQVYGLMWGRIKEFATSLRSDAVFVNTCHSPNQIEPHEFVDFVFREENLKKKGLEGRLENGTFELREVTRDVTTQKKDSDQDNANWFTHQLSIAPSGFDAQINKFSLKNAHDLLYRSEQYNDTFHLWHAKTLPNKSMTNAFWPMNGYARGFEVKVGQVWKSRTVQLGTTVALMGLGLYGGLLYFGFQSEQDERSRLETGLSTLSRSPGAIIDPIYEEPQFILIQQGYFESMLHAAQTKAAKTAVVKQFLQEPFGESVILHYYRETKSDYDLIAIGEAFNMYQMNEHSFIATRYVQARVALCADQNNETNNADEWCSDDIFTVLQGRDQCAHITDREAIDRERMDATNLRSCFTLSAYERKGKDIWSGKLSCVQYQNDNMDCTMQTRLTPAAFLR